MTDEELLEQVFRPLKEKQLPDDGFSDRVMHQIAAIREVAASRMMWRSRLWTILCVTIAAALFVWMRGWEIIAYGMVMLLNNLQQVQTHVLMVLVAIVVLGVVAVSDMVSHERYSVL